MCIRDSVVSASLENGDVSLVKVVSEKGGLLRLVNPFKGKFRIAGKKKMCIRDSIQDVPCLFERFESFDFLTF